MTGFMLVENVSDAAHRGRRFSPAAMHHLLEALPAADDVLWGMSHPDNMPSLRNALHIGRESVGAQVWVTPEGRPRW